PRRRPRAGAGVGRGRAEPSLVNSWSGPGYRGGLPESHDPGRKRIVGMSIAVSVALLVIVCQLWYLQVLEGGRFQEASDKNRIRRGLSIADMQKVEEWKLELPGVIVEVEPQRVYPNSRFAAHLLGYVREANDEQLKQGRYRRGDMVGQTGLERLLDEFLRGKDGGE